MSSTRPLSRQLNASITPASAPVYHCLPAAPRSRVGSRVTWTASGSNPSKDDSSQIPFNIAGALLEDRSAYLGVSRICSKRTFFYPNHARAHLPWQIHSLPRLQSQLNGEMRGFCSLDGPLCCCSVWSPVDQSRQWLGHSRQLLVPELGTLCKAKHGE